MAAESATRPKRRILRYEVPVDDCFHEFALSGEVLHVACRDPQAAKVEFWALDTGGPPVQRGFVVAGTGQPLPWPPGARYVGTALAANGLVWHLLEAP